jgi:hypothetical protein
MEADLPLDGHDGALLRVWLFRDVANVECVGCLLLAVGGELRDATNADGGERPAVLLTLSLSLLTFLFTPLVPCATRSWLAPSNRKWRS